MSEVSRLYRSLIQESHAMQCHAAMSVLWWFYDNHPAVIVNRHLPRIFSSFLNVAAAIQQG